jgi:hypothetical protein
VSNNMQLFLRLNYDGGRAAAGLAQSSAQIKRFADGTSSQLARMRKEAHAFNSAIGGFSNITRLAGAYIGLQTARETLNKNLNFEKTMLSAKQLANMTMAEAATLRQAAIEYSKTGLAGPQELAEAIETLANAGMKAPDIIARLGEINRAAVAFGSSVKDVANMDFDLAEKFKISPEQMRAVHELIYYHSKEGRFEAKSVSSFAPQYMTKMARVGITGVRGVNLAGAILQAVQKAAPATQPGETVTMVEHGLGHIFSPHDKKNMLKYAGIDIKKYTPGGKFYGEGGAQGMVDLAQAMKDAGLSDTHKLSAVFREEKTRDFWYQMITQLDAIKAAMAEGEKKMAEQELQKDYEEKMRSNYGRLAQAMNRFSRAQMSGPVTAMTTGVVDAISFAAENPLQAGAIGIGAFLGGKALLNRLRNGKAGGGAGGFADAAMGLGGVQRVFVVNMPGGMGGGGQLALPPGEGWNPAASAKASRWAGAFGAAKGALKWGAPLAAGLALYDAYDVAHNEQLNAEAKKTEYGRIAGSAVGGLGGAAIGAGIGAAFGGVGAVPGAALGLLFGGLGSWLGGKAGKAATEELVIHNHMHSTIQLDGRVVAEQVEEHIRDAGRRD